MSVASNADWSNFIINPCEMIEKMGKSLDSQQLLDQLKTLIQQRSNETCDQMIPLIYDIKSLNLVRNKSLIKFRCFVQDMFSPDYCIGLSPIVGCDNDEDVREDMISLIRESRTIQRLKFLCQPIPGLNDWVTNEWQTSREQDSGCESSPEMVKRPATGESSSAKKIKPSGDESMEFEAEKTSEKPEAAPNVDSIPQLSCVVYSYENREDILLNSMIEVVGIIEFAESPVESEEKDSNQMDGVYLPSDEDESCPHEHTPRIHALLITKVKDANPFSSDEFTSVDIFTRVRCELHSIFTELLFGDDIAAEYLLFLILSKVYIRRDTVNVGCLPLNIYNMPKMSQEELKVYVDLVYKVISTLLPVTHYLPLSLECMNKESFVPKKNGNRLQTSRLQIPLESFVLIDETVLESGKLGDIGVSNIRTIISVILWQKLFYDFTYYQQEMDCDIEFLILSEGRSMLGAGCKMPIKAKKTEIDLKKMSTSIESKLNPNMLRTIRCYLSKVRQGDFHISNELKDKISDEFARVRQDTDSKSPLSYSADDLHSLINLARLVSISYGNQDLTQNLWLRVLYLEEERKQRL